MANERTIDQLNHLIGVNFNAKAMFQTAAENVRNTEMQTVFANYAAEHTRFYTELQKEIQRLGGSPADSGTTGGAVHRGWMDMKSALTGQSVKSMVASCQTSEQSAESAYLDTIEVNPHGQTHTLLVKHSEQIKGISTRLTRLIGELKNGVEFQKNEE